MAVSALRELRLQSLKRVYRLDAGELCSALQNAAKRRVNNREVWDALLYRAAALRGQFGPNNLALTIDALARIRYRDHAVLDYMLQEVRSKVRSFTVRDVALLLNALAKFGLRDALLLRSLLPTLLRRITEKSKWEDLSLLALSYARLTDPSQALVFDRIVASLTPRMDRIDDGHTLSLLACAFTRGGMDRDDSEMGGDAKPFAEDVTQPLFLPEALTEIDISNRAFVEVLLEQCERHIFSFKGSDVLHLCLALASLVRTGNEDAIPPRLIPRLAKRLEGLYYELLPGQFVRFLELFPYLPEVEAKCGPRILDELVYRARELMPKSCLPMLRASLRLQHARGQSVAAWRLTREDAAMGGPAVLFAAELGEVSEMLLQVALPHRSTAGTSGHKDPGQRDVDENDVRLWEAREALLVLLQGFRRRNLEPKPEILANLLHNAALLSVRDSHWFILCQRLMVPSSAHPKRAPHSMAPSPAEAFMEVLSEADLAKTTLALARLSLPQLVDGASLFSRAAALVRQPAAAVAVLEAAAIFALTERRPQDLTPAALSPLVQAVHEGRRRLSDVEQPEEGGEDLPRLFPFCSRLTQAMTDVAQAAEWREAAAAASAMAAASRTRRPRFQEVVLQELASWGEEVDLQTDVVVGPVCVPFALSFVGLDEFLRRRPLASAEDEDEEESDAESPLASNKAPGLRARRRARRREQASVSRRPSVDIPAEAFPDLPGSDLPGSAKPQSHLLVDLLRYEDFYHASPTLEFRMKGPLVVAEREAETKLLRRLGWHVVCVPEFRWQLGEDGDHEAASEANRRLIFELIADVGGPE